MALAQTTVTGKVVSQDDGEPVIGASIKIEGTKTGTVTFVVDGVPIEVATITLPIPSVVAVMVMLAIMLMAPMVMIWALPLSMARNI